ncbi:hypothetical protein HN51_064818 [Arachis hypogaea]|uniref:PB1 domain-containing protein n=1 Tax=Arachis hypogaea TaxID=3818 RepID=A0A444ZC41_ARAHY|nr:uncharacterized protein LOC107638505 [Arachis ipaensis]XP_020976167.1 uncharacterized protein LOC107638505 [Arachis ipaensis]XP_025645675.1 uncharacterized protein LOC112741069 [Arachis hypogaea]RYR11751.1 hypothetical protein Ahy_B04g069269 [Arachis hypogaea]
MAGEGGDVSVANGADETANPESAASSPKSKVKFMCSHGGKVLPRPSDGLLKYVGGETRVVSVPRNVTFYELMKKLHGMIEGGESMVLKYQLVPEDLDTLVSVRNDEDLKHMIDEHDRHEVGGAPMLRTFMCPLKPLLVVDKDNQGTSGTEPYPLEQRYIDAINGFQRISPRSRPSPIRAAFNAPSACSSPKSNSPDGHTTDLVHESPPFHGHILGLGRRSTMHRVHSSPSISSLSNLHSLAFQQHEHHNHYHNHSPSHQSPCQSQNQGQSQGQGQGQNQGHHPPAHLPASYQRTGPQDQLVGMGRPPPLLALRRSDMGSRSANSSSSTFNYYYPATNNNNCRPPKGYGYYDESPAYGGGMGERVGSVPQSPRNSIWE